ncbi:MAG: hypothetical protein ACRD0Q_00060 [Acidimicrobiales bacterium]
MAEAVPGAVATCDLTVRNAGAVNDSFRFEVKGDASSWARVKPPTLELAPTAEGVVQVVFNIPRSPWPAAGALPVDVKVLSSAEPARPAVAQGVLRIAAFADAYATLEPRLSHGRYRAQHILTIHNRGNAPLGARISLARTDSGLRADLSPAEINVAPGRCGSARVTVSRRLPRLWGAGPSRSFVLRVEAAGVPPVSLDAAMQQEAAGWGLRAAAVAGLLALVGVVSLLATLAG